MPYCQSYGLTPQPFCTSGLTRVVTAALPKVADNHGPHSPLAAGFMKSHCGMKSLLTPRPVVSLQLRAVVAVKDPAPAGLPMMNGPSLLAGCRYLLKLPFTDVLPLPKTSHAAPMRGVMSLKPSTPFFSGNWNGVAWNRDGANTPFSPPGNQLQACS